MDSRIALPGKDFIVMDDQYYRDRSKWKVVGGTEKAESGDSKTGYYQTIRPWITKYGGKRNSASSTSSEHAFDFVQKSSVPVFNEVQNLDSRQTSKSQQKTTTSSSSSSEESENTSSSGEETSSSSQYEWREASPVHPLTIITASVGGHPLPGITRGLKTLIPLKSVFVILFPNNAPDDLIGCLEKLNITTLTTIEAKFLTKKLAMLADAGLRTYTAGGEIYVAHFVPGERACTLHSLENKYDEILEILFSSNRNLSNTDLNANKPKCFKLKLKKNENENCVAPVTVGPHAFIRKYKPRRVPSRESNVKIEDSVGKVFANDKSNCLNASNAEITATNEPSDEPESALCFHSTKALLSKSNTDGSDCKAQGVQSLSTREHKKINVPVLHHLFPENEVSDEDDQMMEEDLINGAGESTEPAADNTKESLVLDSPRNEHKEGNISTNNNNAGALNESPCAKTSPIQSPGIKDDWASMLSVELMSVKEKSKSQSPQCQTEPTVRFLKTSELITNPFDKQEIDNGRSTNNKELQIAGSKTTNQIKTFVHRKMNDKRSSRRKEESGGHLGSPVEEETQSHSYIDRKSPHAMAADTRVVICKREPLASPKNTIPSSVVKVVHVNSLRSTDSQDKESSDSVRSTNDSSRDALGKGSSKKTSDPEKSERESTHEKVNLRHSVVVKPSMASLQEKHRSKFVQKSQKILQTREKRRNERLQRNHDTHRDARNDCSPDNEYKRTVRSKNSRGRSSSAHSKEGSKCSDPKTRYSQGRSQSPRSSEDRNSSKSYDSKEKLSHLGSSKSRHNSRYYGSRQKERYGSDNGESSAPRNDSNNIYFPNYPKDEYFYSPDLYSSLSSSEFDFSDDGDGVSLDDRPKRKILRTKSSYNSARERSRITDRLTKNDVDQELPVGEVLIPFKKSELLPETSQRARSWRLWRGRYPSSSLEEFERWYSARNESPDRNWEPEAPIIQDVTVENMDCVLPSFSLASTSAAIEDLVAGIRQLCEQREKKRQSTNRNRSSKLNKESSYSYRPRRRSHSPSCVRTFSPRSCFDPNTSRRRSLSPVSCVYSPVTNECSRTHKKRSQYDRLQESSNVEQHDVNRAQQKTTMNEARTTSTNRNDARIDRFCDYERNRADRKTGNSPRSPIYNVHYEKSNARRKCNDDITHSSMLGATQLFGTNVQYGGYQTHFRQDISSPAFCGDVEILNNPFLHSPTVISHPRDGWITETIVREEEPGSNNVGGTLDLFANDTFSHQRTRSYEEDQQVIIIKDDPNEPGIEDDTWPFFSADNHHGSSEDDSCDIEVESLMFRRLRDIRVSVSRKKANRIVPPQERKSSYIPEKETKDKNCSKQPLSEHVDENNIGNTNVYIDTVLLEKEVTSTRKCDSPHSDSNSRVCVEETHAGNATTSNNILNSCDLEPALKTKISDTQSKLIVSESQAMNVALPATQKFSTSDGRSWKKILLRKAQNSYDQDLAKQTHSPAPLRDSTNVATIQQQKHSDSSSGTNATTVTAHSESNIIEKEELSQPVPSQLNGELIDKNSIPDTDVNTAALLPEVTCGITESFSESVTGNSAISVTSSATIVHPVTEASEARNELPFNLNKGPTTSAGIEEQEQSVTKSTVTNITRDMTPHVALTSPKATSLSEVSLSGDMVASPTEPLHISTSIHTTHLVNSQPRSNNLNSEAATPTSSGIAKVSSNYPTVPIISLGKARSTGIVVSSGFDQTPQKSLLQQASRSNLRPTPRGIDMSGCISGGLRSRHSLPPRVTPVIQISHSALPTTNAASAHPVVTSPDSSTCGNVETYSTVTPVSIITKPIKSILRATETTVTTIQCEDVTSFINNLNPKNQRKQKRKPLQTGGVKSSPRKKKVTKRRLPNTGPAKGRGKRRKRLPSISSDEDIIEELNSTAIQESKERISNIVQKESVSSSEEDDSDDDLVSFMQIPAIKKEFFEPENSREDNDNVLVSPEQCPREESHNLSQSSDNNSICESPAVLENLTQNDEETQELVEADCNEEHPDPSQKGGDNTTDDENIFSKMTKVMKEEHGEIFEEAKLHDDSILKDSSTPEAEQDLLSKIVNSSILNSCISSADMDASKTHPLGDVVQMNLHETHAPAETIEESATSVLKLVLNSSPDTSCVPILPTPPTSPHSNESAKNSPTTAVTSSATSLATTSKLSIESASAIEKQAAVKLVKVSQIPLAHIESNIFAMPDGENCHGFLEVCMSAECMSLFSLRRVPYVKIVFANTGATSKYSSNSCATYLRLRDIISLLKLKPKELSFLIALCELKMFQANTFTCKLYETVYDPVCTNDPDMRKLTMRNYNSKHVQLFLDRMIALDEFLHTLLPRFYFERLEIQASEVPKYVNVKIFKPIFRIDDEVIKIFRKPYEYNAVLLTKDDHVKCKPLKAMKVATSKMPKLQKKNGTERKARNKASDVKSPSRNVSIGNKSLHNDLDHSVATQLQQRLRYVSGASNRLFDVSPLKLLELNSALINAGRYSADNLYPTSNLQDPLFMKSYSNRNETQYVSQNQIGVPPNANPAQGMGISNGGSFEISMPPPSYFSSVQTRPTVIQSSVRKNTGELPSLSTVIPFQVVQSVSSYPNLNPCVRIGSLMTATPHDSNFTSNVVQTNCLVAENNRSRKESGASDADLAITSVFSLKANPSNQPVIQQEQRWQRDDFSDITENSSDEDNVVPDCTSSSLLTTKEFLSNASKVLSHPNRDIVQGESGLVQQLRSRNNLLKSGLNVANDAVEQRASASATNENSSFDSPPTQNMRLKGVTLNTHKAAKLMHQLSPDNDNRHLSGVVSKLKSRIQTDDDEPTKAKRRKKNSSEGGKRLRGQPKTIAIQKS